MQLLACVLIGQEQTSSKINSVFAIALSKIRHSPSEKILNINLRSILIYYFFIHRIVHHVLNILMILGCKGNDNMTATCVGTFGTYQYMWSRNMQELAAAKPTNSSDQSLVWVTKRYIPTDLRVLAPVPRHKPLSADAKDLPFPDKHWIPQSRITSSRGHYRDRVEEQIYASSPSSRCEEWSTLRQMLPSRGRPSRVYPDNWGTGLAPPPSPTNERQTNFPHINSPMTR